MSFSVGHLDFPWSAGTPDTRAAAKAPAGRVVALDGLRGLMTLFVLFSHYVVEVPHGIVGSVGWVAVIVFFVLSGYLVGRLIIEKQEAGNFLSVFYFRRICRTFPTYFLSTVCILAIVGWLGDRSWVQTSEPLPTWSYFVFAQNIFVATRESVGLHWLAPTWTLAVEEHYYVVAPFIFMAVPRRWWIPVLLGLCAAGLGLRAWGVLSGSLSFAPLVLMPASMDVLCAGLVLAVLVKRDVIDWARWSLPLRMAPIGVLFLIALIQRLDGGVVGPRFQILGPGLTAVAAALFILMLVKGAPEAKRFESRLLSFFGTISYSVYLTHLAVLGLMHGFLLGAEPDFHTPAQIAVTAAAVAVTVALSWLTTRLLEEPMTALGRTIRWR